MKNAKYTIEMLQLSNEKTPFKQWVNSLDSSHAAIVFGRIERVRNGLFGDCKSVGRGVFELRIKVGPGYRVYFGIHKSSIVILISGGDKSSQKRDILKAQSFWRSWEEE